MKKLRLIFISSLILLIVFNAYQESQSCGGDDYWYSDAPREYGLFAPIPKKSLRYARLGFTYHYRPHGQYYIGPKAKNLQEWEKYFEYKISPEAIEEAMYPTKLEDVFQIVQFVEGKSHALSEKLQQNELVQSCKNNPTKTKEFMDYFVYAKLCEPIAQKGYYQMPIQDKKIKIKTIHYTRFYQQKALANPFEPNTTAPPTTIPSANPFEPNTNPFKPTTNPFETTGNHHVPSKTIVYENIEDIADKFNISVRSILKENNIPSKDSPLPNTLKITYAETDYVTPKEESLAYIISKFSKEKIWDFRRKQEIANSLAEYNQWTKEIYPTLVVNNHIPIKNYLKAGTMLEIRKTASKAQKGEKILTDIYIEKNKTGRAFHQIASDYGINTKDLIKWNNYKRFYTTYGQKLFIKTVKYTHKIQKGETLEDIAQKYDISKYNMDNIIRTWNPKPVNNVLTYSRYPHAHNILKKGTTIKIRFDPSLLNQTNLIEKGIQEAQKANNDFMRARYGFQAVRLARYANQYEKAINLYQELIEPIQHKSLMCYRALEHKAGIFQKPFHNSLQANYNFASIFLAEPSLGKIAFRGLQIESDKDWADLLKLCKTTKEKTNLYLLRALSWNADMLAEMENIYTIDANSEHLEILLIKLINTLEYDLLGATLEKENVLFVEDYKGFPQEESYEILQALNQWLEKIIQENKIQNKDFWRLSNAYIQYLNKKPQKAKNTFRDLAQNSQNTQIAKQAKAFNLMLEISELKTITPEIENQVFARVQEFKPKAKQEKKYRYRKTPEEVLFHKLSNFMSQVFALHYKKSKDSGKIALCKPTFNLREEKVSPNLSKIEGMIQLLEKENKSKFEKFLLQKIDTNFSQQQAILYEMQGTVLLYQNKVQEALEAFYKIPNPELNLRVAKYSPLSERQFQKTDETWHKITICEKILALEKLSQKEHKKSIQPLLTLGNIYYNMSYDGNMWWAKGFYHDTRKKIWVGYRYVKAINAFDLMLAKKHYTRAYELARKYKKDNLASKALFLLAKCESQYNWKPYYNIYDYDSKEAFEKDQIEYQQRRTQQKNYLAELRNNYTHTEYYQNVIKECSLIETLFKK